MLVIADTDFSRAVESLISAGFQEWTWSYGSSHPSFYKERSINDIYRRIVRDYQNLDQNAKRFLFPSQHQNTAKIALLPSSYAHIGAGPALGHATDGNLIYPDGPSLLQSFVRTLVREPVVGMWTSTLDMWAIAYLYGELALSDDSLDACDDVRAKLWFNDSIERFGKGIDRLTCTKRLGRVGT